MKSVFYILIGLSLYLVLNKIYAAIVSLIGIYLIIQLLKNSNKILVFREWTLLLYALNYLIAPLITYNISQDKISYPMKIDEDQYFNLAVPGFLFFIIGLYIIPNKLFRPNFIQLNKVSKINESFLLKMALFGVCLRLLSPFVSSEIGFVIYLLATLRFIGAFSLFSLNPRKYLILNVLILGLELIIGFLNGLYHDALMWLIFGAILFVYVTKPRFQTKLIGALGLFTLILFIQAIKHLYREAVWFGNKEASIETVADLGKEKTNTDVLLGEDNLLSTLNRGNQAWIFASTVDRMDLYKDFQGLNNVSLYFESAVLPRFLAPNKLKSGDKEIFNKFSGHALADGTAMGLGIFADGYIAYGTWGVYVFGFCLGLLFSLTFKIIERWTNISPFYVLMVFPLLNYAVRPDCELQTTINHLIKGIILFGFLIYLSRKRFTLDSQANQLRLLHLNLVTTKK